MENNQHPNRCTKAVFGRARAGEGDLSTMGLLSCAGWLNPSVYTDYKMSRSPEYVHPGHASALVFAVAAYHHAGRHGQEGSPVDQD